MAGLTSTYRHDYLPPNVERFGFENQIRTGPLAGLGDKCCRECEAKRKLKGEGEKCKGGEWTRIGPMGPLITPRIIPEEPTELEVHRCLKDKPNRFLSKLCNKYPELYEKLKCFNNDELYRKVESDRMNTSYQIDYCHQREYFGGLYDNLSSKCKNPNGEGNETKKTCEFYKKMSGNKCKKGGFGPEGDADEDPCQGLYRPFRTQCITGIPRGMQSGHWPEQPYQKEPAISEYRDKISNIGKAIIKHKIHDHSKCSQQANCRHKMKLKKTCMKGDCAK